MRIFRQVQRGVKSTGFWAGFLLLIFTLQFVHMDASLYWNDPLAYFGSGDFFYTFIISVYVGILRFLFPLCAILPAGMLYAEDKESRFLIPTLHRQSTRRYVLDRMISAAVISAVMVILAMTVTTVFYLIVCPVEYQEDGFQVAAMASAYGWRAEPKYFAVFVLEATGRLMLSAVFWTFVSLTFSALWTNKVFILIATLVCAYALEAFQLRAGLEEWTVAFVQAPDIRTMSPLWIPLLKQIGYVGCAAVLCFLFLSCSISPYIQRQIQHLRDVLETFTNRLVPAQHLMIPRKALGTRLGKLWVDFRAFCSPATMCCTFVVTVICTMLCQVFSYSKFTIGELLLSTFGGIAWIDPDLNYYAIGKWILLLLPPMMGVAHGLEREFTIRKHVTVYRYGNTHNWWHSKALAIMLFTAVSVCFMFSITIIMGKIMGATGFDVYIIDSDGFSVPGSGILTTMFLQFGLQVMMLTQLQVLFHAVFRDMKAGVIAYLVPMIIQLFACSNVEMPRNMWMPASWGMIARTNIFCATGCYYGDGTWLELCAIEPVKAIVAQIVVFLILYSLNQIVVPHMSLKRN